MATDSPPGLQVASERTRQRFPYYRWKVEWGRPNMIMSMVSGRAESSVGVLPSTGRPGATIALSQGPSRRQETLAIRTAFRCTRGRRGDEARPRTPALAHADQRKLWTQ